MDRKVLSALASGLAVASIEVWFHVHLYPRYKAKCSEIRQRLERKIAMGRKPSRWGELLEKLWCS